MFNFLSFSKINAGIFCCRQLFFSYFIICKFLFNIAKPFTTFSFKLTRIKQRSSVKFIYSIDFKSAIQNIICFINPHFCKNCIKLGFNNFINTAVDGIINHHIYCKNFMALSNTVNTTNTLLNHHRIPRNIVIDNNMSKLHV